MSRLYVLKYVHRVDIPRGEEWKEKLLVIENLNDDGKQIPSNEIMKVVANYVKASKIKFEDFKPVILCSLLTADYLAFGDKENRRVVNELDGLAKIDKRPHLVIDSGGEEKN